VVSLFGVPGTVSSRPSARSAFARLVAVLAIVAGIAMLHDSPCAVGSAGPCLPAGDTASAVTFQVTAAPLVDLNAGAALTPQPPDGVDDVLGA